MMKGEAIESLSAFISGVSKFANEWRVYWIEKTKEENEQATSWLPWFCGEETVQWPTDSALQPKLYRKTTADIKVALEHEQEMRAEFRRRGTQLITSQRQPGDKWEWYFLMQHYRAPTRLLDWSDGALVALHFAISPRGRKDDQFGDADAAVYMLDPWWLNEEAFKAVQPVAALPAG